MGSILNAARLMLDAFFFLECVDFSTNYLSNLKNNMSPSDSDGVCALNFYFTGLSRVIILHVAVNSIKSFATWKTLTVYK